MHAQRQKVDFERGILFLPDSKTGPKPVYLGAAALAILASLPRLEGNPHIVAGMKDGAPRADLKKPWAAVTKAAGLKACASMIRGIPSHRSELALRKGCRSSASFWGIHKQLPRIAMHTSTRTRCGVRPIQSARRSRQLWAVPRGTSCRWRNHVRLSLAG